MEFQSTRPVQGATGHHQGVQERDRNISIHAPRAGRDPYHPVVLVDHHISIHAPRAGRDRPDPADRRSHLYFNPRAPCRARLRPRKGARKKPWISIHAPRAGRDLRYTGTCPDGLNISIHAPRAGRDPQKTEVNCALLHFNPRAPCRARLQDYYNLIFNGGNISIHAPRAGRDFAQW